MRLLLDTHAFLWWTMGGSRVGPRARPLIEDADNEIFLSAASAWEIALKSGAGRLDLSLPADRWVPGRMRRHRFVELPVTIDHAVHVSRLPRLHGDPFDRILVAQAQRERLVILTVDPAIERYDVDTIW